MNRRLTALATAALVAPLLIAAPASAQSTPTVDDFHAPLSGDQEVPAVTTDASGVAAISLDDTGTGLDYVLITYGLTDVTGAHIHEGAEDENGGILAPLFTPDAAVTRDGVLVRGHLTEEDLASGTMDDLLAAMRSGDTYVNVHTEAQPAGEIRGQIGGLEPSDGMRFDDDDDSVHEHNIERLAASGITSGIDENSYGPGLDITRGQLATFLVVALALPPSDTDAFDDDTGSPHEANINAIAAAGLTEGCADAAYCPNDPVTRGQFASLIVPALGLDAGTQSASGHGAVDLFGDDETSVHENNIDLLGMAGITRGINPPQNTAYGPELSLSRGQAATFTSHIMGWEAPQPLFALTILHNNDGESALLDDEGVGGAARFKTVVDLARTMGDAMTDGTLMLSSGDNFLAGPSFTASQELGTFFDVLLLEAVGYDAIDIGNHDFDFGPDVLAEFIGAFETPPPYLSANLDVSGEPALQQLADDGVILPSTMVEVGGHQVGIVGATTPALPFVSSPRNVEVDDDVAARVQEQIDLLEADGADIVIMISHLQNIDEDLELAPEISGLDVMIAGGGDELLANPDDTLVPGDEEEVFGAYPLYTTNAEGDTVPVVTTSGQYNYLGNLVATFTQDGAFFNAANASGPLAVMDHPQDSAVKEAVEDPIADFVSDLATEVIATSEVDLNGVRGDVRTRETNQGDLIADSLLWQATQLAADFGAPEPDVALQNGGGIRNDSVLEAGDVTELDTFDMVPFANYVTIIPDISRDQFKEILENAVSAVEDVDGRFAQVAGFTFTYDPAGTPQELDEDGNVVTPGTRVQEVTLDGGTPVVLEGTVVPGPSVVVATIDFLARGGDQYPFRGASFTSVGVSYQQALSDYIQAPAAEGGLEGSITAADYPEGGEGRITTE